MFQDAPDSPKDDPGSLVPGGINNVNPLEAESGASVDAKGRPSRHLLYTTHFPLPQVKVYKELFCKTNFEFLWQFTNLRSELREPKQCHINSSLIG